MIQRSGQVLLQMLPDVRQKTIKPIIEAGVAEGTLIYTDEYDIYARLEEWGYEHKSVHHGAGEYARDEDGDGFHEVHVNTMEGSGRCCAPGYDRIGASRRKNCRSTSASFSSFTMPASEASNCSGRSWARWSLDGGTTP
jgi:hypothetical protein